MLRGTARIFVLHYKDIIAYVSYDEIIIVASLDVYDGHVISGPDIVSRGFVYVREAEQLMDDARELARKALENCIRHNPYDWNTMKTRVRDELSRMLFQKTKKSPIILPIIMDM